LCNKRVLDELNCGAFITELDKAKAGGLTALTGDFCVCSGTNANQNEDDKPFAHDEGLLSGDIYIIPQKSRKK
jgi:hypothetical protein